MPALLFGSIGTIADTSEIQRQAFNQAFARHGLDWYWPREVYLEMLMKSGGRERVLDYARSREQRVDTDAIHRSKSVVFQQCLMTARISPRPGVVETIGIAKSQGFRLALVTGTSKENVSALLKALHPEIQRPDFELITDASVVDRPKPASDIYLFALDALGEKAGDCIAIEDNLDGVEAAIAAGIHCVAFPGENTMGSDLSKAQLQVDHLDFEGLRQYFAEPSA